jgi:HSP20 family protein
MTVSEAKALEARDKQEVSTSVEQTRPGATFVPAVDILENDETIILIADMPGVKVENLDINLCQNVLTLTGETDSVEGKDETIILQEYRTGRYVRQFSLSDVIDQANIKAELTDGILRLVLPKSEKAIPRKIAVKTG